MELLLSHLFRVRVRRVSMPKFAQCWQCSTNNTSIVCPRCRVAKYCSIGCQTDDQIRHEVDCDAAIVNKTCAFCLKTSANMQMCCACCQEYYCDNICQRKAWPLHKEHCEAVVKRIKAIAENMEERFSARGVGLSELYYWGTTPAFDCLNLGENEGCDHKHDLSLLFYGVGDLRNVAFTCASLPEAFEGRVRFALNDVEPCTLARVVVLLYMLINGESGIEEQIVEVWYSLKLSEQTYNSLRTFLQQLLDITSIKNGLHCSTQLISISDEHLKELRSVWKAWLDLNVLKTTWMKEQRKLAFKSHPGSKSKINAYYNAIPPEHVASMKEWVENGVFCKPGVLLVAENPTLAGSPVGIKDTLFHFCCPPSVFPFTSFDYHEVKKCYYCHSIVEMYRIYTQNILQKFKRKLAAGCILFQVLLGNCVEVDQCLGPDLKYDRILTSNLCDFIPYPQLLKLCSAKLNHENRHATIVTETYNWSYFYSLTADVITKKPFSIAALQLAAQHDKDNSQLVNKGGPANLRDCTNTYDEFLEYLRASFLAFQPGEQHRGLPSLKTLGNKFQLQLRDYTRNENRLAFFKLTVNCHPVTMISGLERVLEWASMRIENLI